MIKGFWEKLNPSGAAGGVKKPIYVLAPMANVTDAAFRRLIAKYGKPDVIWTEFVSVEALLSRGRENALIDFWYDEKTERPIVAQIFGSKPEQFFEVAKLIKDLGFDGIDINMGCPDKNVEKQCAGAYLMKNPELAKDIIRATKEGAPDLPVSVKTRIGYKQNQLETWLPELLSVNPVAVTIHARTRNEMSLVPAQWEKISQAVQIRNQLNPDVLILGNGDVENLTQADERVKETGADGVMIGRGIFGNPWLFSREKNRDRLSIEERLAVMLEHTYLFKELFAGKKNFDIMKKHYKAYVSGFDGAAELRKELMETKTYEQIRGIILEHYPRVAEFNPQ